MDDDTLRTIGELAELTGLPVKTIRFWSDTGVVPPTARTPAGCRPDRAVRSRPDSLRHAAGSDWRSGVTGCGRERKPGGRI